MDVKRSVQFVAILMLVGGVLACAVETGHMVQGIDPSRSSKHVQADPLAAELRRCNALGAEDVNDSACKAAWAKDRERFLDPASNGSDEPSRAMSRPSAKLPSEMFPERAPSSLWPDASQKWSQDR